MLETGIQAPEFTLPDQNGELHSLKDLGSAKTVLLPTSVLRKSRA